MSHVSISKSYAVLVGLEGYKRIKKKKRALRERLDTRKQKMQSQHSDAAKLASEDDQGAGIAVEKKKDAIAQRQHAVDDDSTGPCPEADAETAAVAAAPPDSATIPKSYNSPVPGEKTNQPEDKKSPADCSKSHKSGGTIWTSLKKIAHHRKPKDEISTPPPIDAGVTKVERRHEGSA